MIDFHCHLDLYKDPIRVAEEANRINKFTLCVTTSPKAWSVTSQVYKQYNNIKVALGLHPEMVERKINELDLMLASIQHTKYIGEIGLDGLPQNRSSFRVQIKVFEEIVRQCHREGGRVLSIHSRFAVQEVLTVLKKYPNSGTPVLHWFSGSLSELKDAIDIGCYFSVNEPMISSPKGRALVGKMPLRRVLPETDGPFAQRGGVPLRPSDVCKVERAIAEIFFGLSYNLESNAKILHDNSQ